MNDSINADLWWIAIGSAAVVTIVVAILLWLIIRTASDIKVAVAEIWARGQRVANNTIHIPTLYKTDELVGDIKERAGSILFSVSTLADHAFACPGCPECLADESAMRRRP